MSRRRLLSLGALLAVAAAAPAHASPDAAELFEREIRPLLTNVCMECHGGEKVEGGLRVDSRESLLSGGAHGPAIVPGKPKESLLVQAVRRTHSDIQMPPEEPLDRRRVQAVAKWVALGAKWPDGDAPTGALPADWAFEPIHDPTVPEVSNEAWVRTPIDRFIVARLEERGIPPTPPADRRTLIRRATVDLLGLPPSPSAVGRFLSDESPGAYDRLLDRLLASPRYGERWGRHWLDLARYADTYGDAADAPVPEARRYRNYVIDAFNQDLPYDRFIVEQIAGDILARNKTTERWKERMIATGFVALSRRFGNAAYADMHLIIQNTIDTIGKSMLGMTLSCARCHDHKFDPITQEDYYGLYGYFKSTEYPHAGTEHNPGRRNFVPLTTDDDAFRKWRRLDAERAKLTDKLDNGKGHTSAIKKRLNQITKDMPDVPVAYGVLDKENPSAARIHKSGNPEKKGEKVARGFIDRITDRDASIPDGRSGRLALARWIASEDNPLTARVLVNRVWQYHFGRGLVKTSSTFGAQGKQPTHPALLDWLASRFVEDGWSIKALHRRIMRSATYRRSSVAARRRGRKKDPSNKLYWHFPSRRMRAEAIRDSVLAVSGRLDLRRPGPHPYPKPDKWGRYSYTQHNPFRKDYSHNHRTLYLVYRRLGLHPFLAMFGGPDTNESTARRTVSTVPLQSLFWMNSDFAQNNARSFAERILRRRTGRAARIRDAYELAYARPPTAEERTRAVDYLARYERRLSQGLSEKERTTRAWKSLCRVLLSSNEFLYVD